MEITEGVERQPGAMTRALFPPEVVVVTATAADPLDPLYPEEEATVRRAVRKRRLEFAAGRSCARRALAQLGWPRRPIAVGPDRAPLWPDDVVGSITHCEGFTGAVVARRQAIAGLGWDAEPAAPLDPSLVPLICTELERRELHRRYPGALELWAKTLFCAKEAAFKCLFPLWRVWFDFHDIRIALQADAGRFAVHPASAVGQALRDLQRVEGRFVRTPSHWIVGAYIRS